MNEGESEQASERASEQEWVRKYKQNFTTKWTRNRNRWVLLRGYKKKIK